MIGSMIPSAVVVPQPDEVSVQASPSHKRRQSSREHDTSKRPRLDSVISQQSLDGRTPEKAGSPLRPKFPVVGTGAVEERKRGQRLFGALLGTLSQSSAKPAHRRRDEIERRQQDKLRQKDEDFAEAKKKQRDKLDEARRAEQKIWNEQAVRSLAFISKWVAF